MAKTNKAKTTPAQTTPVTTAQPTPAPAPAPTPQATNHTLTYRKDHPGNRCSYGVAGVPGIVVFDKKLFADGKAPATILLDCALAVPVAKATKAKAVAAVAA